MLVGVSYGRVCMVWQLWCSVDWFDAIRYVRLGLVTAV